MPGKPRAAALEAHLREEVEGRARVEFLLELIANGQTIAEVASVVTVVYRGEKWTPSREAVGQLLRKRWPEELAEARRVAGDAHAEEQLTVLKNAPETKEGIAKARELASAHRWLAAKRDPANFGDTPALAIQVNNPGQLFLQAVARPGAVQPPKQKTLPGDARGVGTAPKDETDNDGA